MSSKNDSSNMELEARYKRALQCEQAGYDRSKKIATNAMVIPHWIGDSDCFWYLRESFLATEIAKEFRLVNATTGVNEAAFDQQALASTLASVTGENVDSDNLPFVDIELCLSSEKISFDAFGRHWQYHSSNAICEEVAVHPHNWKVSPDGEKAIFSRGGNLWLHNISNGEEKALTHDGERFYAYASTPSAYGRQEGITLEALWSSDSKRIFTLVKDTRNVNVGPPLVRHVPPSGDLRPDIIDPDRRLAYPGDEHVEGYYFLAIDVDSGERRDADYRLCPVFPPPYVGFFSGGRGWWSPDNRRAYFIDLERKGLNGRLVEFDTDTGKTRTLIDETSGSRFNFIPVTHLGVILKPLPGGKELIWFSERSGWAHIYLYDLETGGLKNAITQGDWLVRNILHYDAESRELLIQTAGRVSGRNPYYRDICRVNIDTGELIPVLSTDDEYSICDPISREIFGKQGVSASGQYIVATRSRVDKIPVNLLLNRQGEIVTELETADVSRLPNGWQWPEPVALKSADGNSDIYGVVFRPSNFSPDKSYPILDFSSNGDYIPASSLTSTMSYFTPAAYAELGFIVVMIRSRGTSLRSMEFQNDKDSPFLHTSHQDDCIAGIQQLAERHSYMDINRIGLGGYSSPPTVLNGMFRYPDFYKVGVSFGVFADSRIVWGAFGEMSNDESLSTEEFNQLNCFDDEVGNLKGKLLLIHGMLDNCTPVATTFRLVEKLQRANKDFDMLLLPNAGHSNYRYVTRRTWDYFVQHLQRLEPPKEFELPAILDRDDPGIYSYKDVLVKN